MLGLLSDESVVNKFGRRRLIVSLDLEERAGQLVELIGSHRGSEEIAKQSRSELPKLAADAGRFRRHKVLMQAIRDLHHGLSCLLSDKIHHRDFQDLAGEINVLYDKLLAECDKVTGKRKV